MLLSDLRPEGERFLRGEGPRRLRDAGGSGVWASVYGEAADWPLLLSLTSVPRLRMMCALCHDGWTRGPALAKRLGLHVNSVTGALHGLKDTYMVTNRPSAIGWPYSRSKTGGVYALDWAPTGAGLLMFRRFAETTSRLLPWVWRECQEVDLSGHDALRGLTVYAQESLVRPMWLALAHGLLWKPHTTEVEMARQMGVPRAAIAYRMRRWREMGWLEETPRYYPMDRFHRTRHAPSWKFSRTGVVAMENHVYGVCMAVWYK